MNGTEHHQIRETIPNGGNPMLNVVFGHLHVLSDFLNFCNSFNVVG